jgi:hypothetical protein
MVIEIKSRLVRKVKFRVLTSYKNKMYNSNSHPASVFSCCASKTERMIIGWERNSGAIEDLGGVADSSSSIRINEP